MGGSYRQVGRRSRGSVSLTTSTLKFRLKPRVFFLYIVFWPRSRRLSCIHKEDSSRAKLSCQAWFTHDVMESIKCFDSSKDRKVTLNMYVYDKIMISVRMITTNSAMFSWRPVCSFTGEGCREGLGMENGNIDDNQITASSERPFYKAVNARLRYKNQQGRPFGWQPKNSRYTEWLQVDLLLDNYIVTGVATQGCLANRKKKRVFSVTKYQLEYSNDGKVFSANHKVSLFRSSWRYPKAVIFFFRINSKLKYFCLNVNYVKPNHMYFETDFKVFKMYF